MGLYVPVWGYRRRAHRVNHCNRAARLLRCMSPKVTHRDVSLRCRISDTIGSEADMRERQRWADLTKIWGRPFTINLGV
jgi:hypothetical protein